MTLPDPLQERLGWIVRFFDRWIPRSIYAIGGGTILAARWQHRLSTDIDLFAEEEALASTLDKNTWREIYEALEREASDGAITGLVLKPTGFSFTMPRGPISFHSIPRLTANSISHERENTTGVYAERTTEILFQKLRGRMINTVRYLARDLYDVVICYGVDRESLDAAMEAISPLERESFRYDVQLGDTNVSDLDRVLKPAYPDLIANLERFNLVAGEILAQDVSATTDRFLKDIGITA